MPDQLLKFYVREDQLHEGQPAWQWLLELANQRGIRGGSAFKAMAGFGRHHTLHEAKFFELAGSLAIEVEFIVSQAEADTLLKLLQQQGIRSFYARIPAQLGVINPDAADSPAT